MAKLNPTQQWGKGELVIYDAVSQCPHCAAFNKHQTFSMDIDKPKIERCQVCKGWYAIRMTTPIVLESGKIDYSETIVN